MAQPAFRPPTDPANLADLLRQMTQSALRDFCAAHKAEALMAATDEEQNRLADKLGKALLLKANNLSLRLGRPVVTGIAWPEDPNEPYVFRVVAGTRDDSGAAVFHDDELRFDSPVH